MATKKVVKKASKQKGEQPKISDEIVHAQAPEAAPEPIVQEATDADVREAKEKTREEVLKPAVNEPGPGERLFECPAGHFIVGQISRDTAFCTPCGVMANPRR